MLDNFKIAFYIIVAFTVGVSFINFFLALS